MPSIRIEMHYYTYAYLREDRTPYYIGKGKGDRIYSTSSRIIKPPKDKSRIIYLKQNLTEEEAFKHEIYMIDVFGRKDLGTGILHNRTDGGEGRSGSILSEETKRKISNANKGEKNYHYGKSLSEETKIKLSEAHKGKTLSEETKRKMSESRKGRIVSEETRKKQSESNKGKTRSEESRKKMSESQKGRIVSEETRKKLRGIPRSQEVKDKISEAKKGENHYLYGKSLSEETKTKISKAQKGKKWWSDGCGNSVFMVECPGNNWYNGRGNYFRKSKKLYE